MDTYAILLASVKEGSCLVTRGKDAKSGKAGAVTSRDVAKALNISQSTVSRAFTPGASISPALRERIYAAAEKVGYRPNLLARGLIAGKSKLVGVVLARQTGLLYPELLYELSGRLSEQGYQVLLFPIGEGVEVHEVIDRIWAFRVDAVLATGVLGEADVEAFEKHGLPLVMFNRVFDLPVSTVCCDFAAGARDLAVRMLRAGHRDIGLISGLEDSFVGGEVERGVRAAIAGHDGVRLTVVHADYSYASAAPALQDLIGAAGGIPGSILCVNDTVAAGCLDQLRGSLKKKVPQDVSLAAFGGFGPARWGSYQISGMVQPMEAMTAAAAEMLLDRVDDATRGAERRMFLPGLTLGATAILG